jgi:hypothetical protein
MPASAPSCWAQGSQLRRTTNMPFRFLLRVGFYERDHRGSPVLLPTGLSLPNSIHDICPLLEYLERPANKWESIRWQTLTWQFQH